jgi:predicted Zn-dependent protease
MIVLGDTQLKSKAPADAAATYRKAFDKSHTTLPVQRLFTALGASGHAAEAEATLKDWTAKNPSDLQSRLLLTSYYIDAGKHADAIHEAESINAASPDNPIVLNNLAWLYGEQKDPKAIVFAQKAYALAPKSPDVTDTFGWLQVNSGDATKGAELLGKAHALAPGRPDISYRYAVALQKKGDPAKAKAILQNALTTTVSFTERKQAEALLKQLGG